MLFIIKPFRKEVSTFIFIFFIKAGGVHIYFKIFKLSARGFFKYFFFRKTQRDFYDMDILHYRIVKVAVKRRLNS